MAIHSWFGRKDSIEHHERALLSELCFNTVGFQIILDKSLLLRCGGKHLWTAVLPEAIKRCRDVNKLRSCEHHLDELIPLWQAKALDLQKMQSISNFEDRHMRKLRYRHHMYMSRILFTLKNLVIKRVSKLARSDDVTCTTSETRSSCDAFDSDEEFLSAVSSTNSFSW